MAHNYHSHPPLTPQVEYNYILTWFMEFSEYERKDFLKVMIEYLLNSSQNSGVQNGVYMNGICNMSSSTLQEKPMSLFQCRMKLFKEWSQNWPDEIRTKLIDNINDIDPDFGLKLNQELEEFFQQDNTEAAQENNNIAENGVLIDTN